MYVYIHTRTVRNKEINSFSNLSFTFDYMYTFILLDYYYYHIISKIYWGYFAVFKYIYNFIQFNKHF